MPPIPFNVDPETKSIDEPKFMVFYGVLVSLFSLFCFKCKGNGPKVAVVSYGSMVTVTQTCSHCCEPFKWNNQPFFEIFLLEMH